MCGGGGREGGMGWSTCAVLLKVSGFSVWLHCLCVCWGVGGGGEVEYVCCPAESEWVWCLVRLFVCVLGGGGGGEVCLLSS